MRLRPDDRPAAQKGGLLATAVLLLLALVGAAAAGTAPAAAQDDVVDVSLYAAPDGSFDGASAVRAAIDAGRLEPADRVVVGDVLVVAIDSVRLADDLAAANGTTTERLFAVLEGNATLRVVQTDASTHSPPKLLALGPANVTAHRDGATTYAVVDTAALDVRYAYPERHRFGDATLYGGERFAVEFGYHLEPVPVSGSSSGPFVGPAFRLVLTHGEFTWDTHRDAPLPPEVVSRQVRVEVPPDDSAVVRLQVGDGRTVSYPLDLGALPGNDRVWFDLRGVEPGTPYALALVHDGEVVDGYEGVVREPRASLRDPTLTAIDAEVEGQAALHVTARLSHGGELHVLDETCDRVGWARLPAGEPTRARLVLWRPSGEPLPLEAVQGEPLVVRAIREAGATTPRYEGPAATASLAGGTDLSCGPSESIVTPPDGAPVVLPRPTDGASVSTAPSPTPDETPHPMTPGDGTSTPGQPGFTPLTMLAGLLALVVWWASRR